MAASFQTAFLAFFAKRNPSTSTRTIRLRDSLRGYLALGLDFPVALSLAIRSHLFLRDTSLFSLNINTSSIRTLKPPLDGIDVDEKKQYTCSEILTAARPKGITVQAHAYGLWSLASDVKTGLLQGADVVKYQQGTLYESLEGRRKGRDQVLPLYRGGPIWLGGHAWFAKRCLDVDVCQQR